MAIYLEQRFYSREEIATLFSLDASNQNFSRQIKTKLNNLGYKEKEIKPEKELTKESVLEVIDAAEVDKYEFFKED